MPTTQKVKDKKKLSSTIEFNNRYTQSPEGFYIRNNKPSPGKLSAERIADNLRHLLRETERPKGAE